MAAPGLLLAAAALGGAAPNYTQLVYDYVKANASSTYREAQGVLPFPHLVPAGPYNQLCVVRASLAARAAPI
jgi:hypothetical protein